MPELAIHFALSTASAPARDAFVCGLSFVYAYNGEAAYAQFAQAARADPNFAMAYAGEALAAGPDLNQPMDAARFAQAKIAIGAALRLESKASAPERAYVEALALRYAGEWPNDGARDSEAYRSAMERLVAQYPDDEDGQVLTAEALLENGDGSPGGNRSSNAGDAHALQLVRSVLARNPANVMANHLCVHLYDGANDRTPALACAMRLDAFPASPATEHLAHMPAHTWIETGNYARAVASSLRAYSLLAQLPDGDPHRAFYTAHDVYVGYSAAMMLLDYGSAMLWAKRFDAARPAAGNLFQTQAMLRFGRNQEAYDAATPGTPQMRALRAEAAVRLNRVAEAVALLGQAADSESALAASAAISEKRGRFSDARRVLLSMIRTQHAAFENELIPIVPAEERLGGLDLRSGDPNLAEVDFRSALTRYPNDPRALFGLATALDRQNRETEAANVRAQLAAQGGDTSFLRIEDL